MTALLTDASGNTPARVDSDHRLPLEKGPRVEGFLGRFQRQGLQRYSSRYDHMSDSLEMEYTPDSLEMERLRAY